MDIMVLDVNSSRTKNLASGLASSSGTGGLQLPVAFSPRNPVTTTSTSGTSSTSTTSSGTSSTTTSTAVSLGQIGKIEFSDFSVSLPGALLEAIVSDSTTRILQSPQVRAWDGQKVVLKIGDRVPYATGSYQAGTTATTSTVSALVSTEFSYADVGVNIELTPHVQGDGEIAMHLSVEISTVSSYVSIGGLSQPIISQRKDEADIRMRNGEVNLMGGLTQLSDTKSLSGIPGLVNIPILVKVLSSNSTMDKSTGELLIAVVPHILRAADFLAADLAEVGTGTDQVVRVAYAPEQSVPAANTPYPALAISGQNPAGGVIFSPESVRVARGAQFTVTVSLAGEKDLSKSSIRLQWNSRLLRLDQIGEPHIGTGADHLIFDVRNDAAEALISATPGFSPLHSGGVARITFTALNAGDGPVNAMLEPVQTTFKSVTSTAVTVDWKVHGSTAPASAVNADA